MRGWVLGTIFCLAIFFSFSDARAHEGHVLISSFQIAGETTTDEFIELYNPTTSSISLLNYRLAKKTSSGTIYNILTTFPEKKIDPGKTFTVAHNNSLFESDIYYSTSTSIAEDNTILLFSDQGKTVIDKVGFGKATDFEGMPAENPKVKEILTRKNYQDTENNFYDFSKEETIVTTDSTSKPSVYITEIMPNPTGTDTENEWIEIYNAGEKTDLGGLYLTDKIGSVKKYPFPIGTFIEKGSYFVIYSKQSRISLNNDGDIVELYSAQGELLDSSGESFGKATEGMSLAFDGDKWLWTKSPSPGNQNIIEEPAAVEKKTAVKATKSATRVKKAAKPKAKSKSGEVLGETNEDEELFAERSEKVLSERDRILGYGLIAVALGGGLLYTVVVNKEKLIEVFNQEREGYAKSWGKIRARFKRR